MVGTMYLSIVFCQVIIIAKRQRHLEVINELVDGGDIRNHLPRRQDRESLLLRVQMARQTKSGTIMYSTCLRSTSYYRFSEKEHSRCADAFLRIDFLRWLCDKCSNGVLTYTPHSKKCAQFGELSESRLIQFGQMLTFDNRSPVHAERRMILNGIGDIQNHFGRLSHQECK